MMNRHQWALAMGLGVGVFAGSWGWGAVSNTLVISEVQVAGGTTSDEFIEIYNPTASNIDLNGYRLVMRTTSGTTDTNLFNWTSSTIITAKSYILVASTSYDGSPAANHTWVGNLIAVNQGVGLRYGALDSGTKIDSVAFGTATNAFRETTAVSNPAANGSVERKANGSSTAGTMGSGGADEFSGNGEETNVNSADFVVRTTSQPQNKSSLPEPDTTAPAAITNLSVGSGTSSGELTLIWTAPGNDSWVGTAASYVVKYSNSAISNQTDFNNATTYTQSWTPAAALAAESRTLTGLVAGTLYYIAVEAKDGVPNQANMSNTNGNSASTPLMANHMVISEIQLDGNSGTPTRDEFIELYNPSNSSIDLNGYRLVKRTTAGASDTNIYNWTVSTIVPPKKFYLVGGTQYNASPVANVTFVGNNLIAVNEGAALRNGALDTGAIVDSVAWGSATNAFREGGVAASNPSANGSIERKTTSASTAASLAVGGSQQNSGNGYDSNVNGNDFVVQTASVPQSSTSGEEPDITFPAAITNLGASTGSTEGKVSISWTTPGDDGWTGTATSYLVKYSASAISNQTDFNNATTYVQSWTPLAGGSTENQVLSGLVAGTTYYIAIEALDDLNNQGAMSNTSGNSASAQTDVTAPAALTNLAAATGTYETEINLSWKAAGDDGWEGTATSYLVKYSTNPITTQPQFDAASLYTQSWTPLSALSNESQTLTGLTRGTTYYISIQTRDEVPSGSGLSNTSGNSAPAATDTLAPAAITDLRGATGSTEGVIHLTWTAAADNGWTGAAATDYIVKYSTSPIGNQTAFNNATTYAQSWTPKNPFQTEVQTLSGLTGGATYFLAVEARDEAPNQASLSNSLSAMAQSDLVSPAAITNLAGGTGVAEGTVVLTWAAPGDNTWSGTATSYVVKYSATPIGDQTAFNAATTYSQSWTPKAALQAETQTLSGLTSGATYFLAIEAKDDVNNQGTLSNSLSAVAQSDLIAPAAITGWVGAPGPTEGTIRLTWVAPGDDNWTGTSTSYLVKYSASPISNQGLFNGATSYSQFWAPKAALQTETQTLSGLTGGATYYLAIEAKDDVDNQGVLSNSLSVEAQTDVTAPAALTNLAAGTGPQHTELTLSWIAPGDDGWTGTSSSYVVKYSNSPISDQTAFTNANTYSQSWTPKAALQSESRTLTGFTPGTSYYLAIEAKDEVPNQATVSNSMSASARNDTTAPAALTNLVASPGGDSGQIALTWTAPGDETWTGSATVYVVRYSTSPIPDQSAFDAANDYVQSWVPVAGGTGESRTLLGLNPGTTYFVAVEAVDEASNQGSLSNSMSASAQTDTNAPNAVADLVAGTGLQHTEITLLWTAPGDDGDGTGTATGYTLKYSTGGAINAGNYDAATTYSQSWIPVAGGQPEVRTVTGLAAGTTYYFALKAYDEKPNVSALSNSPNASAKNDTTAPAALTNLAASTGATEGMISLTWVAPGDDNWTGPAVGYEVKYSSSAISDGNYASATTYVQSWTPVAALQGESRTLSGLAGGTTYYIAVKALDEKPNTGAISNTTGNSAAAQGDVTSPAAITNLAAATGLTEGQVTLSWTAPGDNDWTGTATSYEVKYSTSAINAGNYASATTYSQSWTPVGGGSVEARTLAGLAAGTTYYVAVKAKDEVPNTGGLSNTSGNSASAQTDVTAPAALTGWSGVSGTTEGTIQLTWVAPGDDNWTGTAGSYLVKYSTTAIGNQSAFNAANTYNQSWVPKAALQTETQTLSGLVNGTTYFIAIEGKDEVPNQAALSSSLSVVALADTVAPAAITNLAATIGGAEGQINLSWTAPGDNTWTGTATSYEVKYSTSAIDSGNYASATTYSQSWTPVSGGSTEGRTLSGLTGGTTYYIAVKAKDEVPNTGGLSNTSGNSAAAQTDVTSPSALTNLAASTGSNEGEINLTWTASGDDGWSGTANSYVVKYSVDPITNDTEFNSASTYAQSWNPVSAGSAENRTMTGLSGGVLYYLSVKTRDEVPNASAVSNNPSATSQSDIIAPAALTNLAAATGATEGTIQLTWTAPGDNTWSGTATSYVVKYSVSAITNQTDFNNATTYAQGWTPKTSLQTETQTLNGLVNGTTYYLALETKDDVNNQATLSNSMSASAKTDTVLPAAITNVAAVTGGSVGEIDLTWTSPGDNAWSGTATSYVVKYSTSAIANQTDFNNATTYAQSWTPQPGGTPETQTMSGLTGGTTYYIAIEAVDEAPNQGAMSNTSGNSAVASQIANHLVISEVQVAGGTTSDEFIEIYNPTNANVDLNGYRLVRRTTSGTADTNLYNWTSSTIIGPKKFVLAASTSYDGSPAADFTWVGNLIVTSQGFGLRNGALDTGTIVDSVAIGTATNVFREVTAASNPAAGGSVERKALSTSTNVSLASGGAHENEGNGYDSNNNSSDFVVQTTSVPQNASSGEEPDATPPAALTNLAASTGDTEGKIILSWKAPGDDAWTGTAVSYLVKYSTSAITTQNLFDSATTYVQSWTPAAALATENRTLTSLNPGVTYYIAIEAKDEKDNQGALSNTSGNSVSAQTDVTAPATLTNLAGATGTTEGLIQLTWTAPGDDGWTGTASSYVVKYSTSAIGSQGAFNAATTYSQSWTPKAALQTETYTLSGLSGGTTYYLAIEAEDDIPNQATVSNSLSVVAQSDVTLPAAITNLSGTPGTTEGKINLSWTASGDDGWTGSATSYLVKYSASPIGDQTAFNNATTYVQSWIPVEAGLTENRVLSGLTGGTTYFLAVEAKDELNNQATISNSLSVTAQSDVTLPAALTNLVGATGATEGLITLTWIAPGDDSWTGPAFSYVVKYSASPIPDQTAFNAATTYAQSWTPVAALQGESRTLSGLTGGATYYLAIEALDEASNQAALSNSLSVVSQNDVTAPAAITNLSGGTGAVEGAIHLTWVAPGDNDWSGTASSYVVKYSTSAIENQGLFNAATTYSQSWTPKAALQTETQTLSGLTGGTTYFLAIETKDDLNNQANLSNSLVASAQTDVTPPSVIADLTAGTGAQHTELTLRWTAPGDDAGSGTASGYTLKYATSGAITDEASFNAATTYPSPPTPGAAGTVHQLTLSGLTAGATYYFALKTYDDKPNPSGISNSPNAEAKNDVTPPAALTNLAAGTGFNAGELTLTWIAPGDDAWNASGVVLSYEVKYSTSVINDVSSYASATLYAQSWTPAAPLAAEVRTLSGLLLNTQYYVAVKTRDETPNWSALPSNLPVSATSQDDVTAPGAIGDLSAGTGLQHTEITLRWTAPGDDGAATGTVSGYTLRYSASAITNETDFNNATTYSQAWTGLAAGGQSEVRTVTGFTAGNTYHFALKAFDEKPNPGNVSNSASASAKNDTTAPAALTNLAASTGSTEGTIQLTWVAPGDDGWTGNATSYEVKYSTSAINSGNYSSATTYAQTWVPAAVFQGELRTLSGLNSGTTYYIAIKAKDEKPNTGAISNTTGNSAQAQSDISFPAAITNLAGSSGSVEGEINLSWTAPGDNDWSGTATSYVVKYSISPIGDQTAFNNATTYSQNWTPVGGGSGEGRTLTGLTNGTTYFIAMEARDDASNQGTLSNSLSAAAQIDITAPAAITNLSGSAGSSEGEVNLSWTAPGDNGWNGTTVSYVVKYSTSAIGNPTAFNDAATYVQSWIPAAGGVTENRTLTGLVNGTTYFIAVEAVDEFPNQGSLSNSLSAVASSDATAPAAVTNMAGSPGGSEGEINVTWTAPGDNVWSGTSTSYVMKYSTSPITNQTDFNNATTYTQSWTPAAAGQSESFALAGLVNGTAYFLAVEAKDEIPNQAGLSNSLSVSAQVDTIAPAALTNLSGGPGSVEGTIHLTWTVPGDNTWSGTATSYVVKYSTTALGNQSLFNSALTYTQSLTPSAAGSTQSLTLSGLAGNTVYFLAVEAKDEVPNQATLSNSLSVTSQADVTAPAALTNMSAGTGEAEGTIHLTWVAPGDDGWTGTATSYVVKYSTTALTDQASFNGASTYAQSWTPKGVLQTETQTLSGLVNGTTYFLAIEAKDEFNNQATLSVSASAAARTDTVLPAAITNLAAAVGESVGEISVTWTAPGDNAWSGTATSYLVKYSTTAITDQAGFNGATTYAQSWTPVAGGSSEAQVLSGLIAGTTYFVAIEAKDEANNQGGLSNTSGNSAAASQIANHLVISEVQVQGAVANDEFVEIYNPTNSNVDLNGYKLVARATAGAVDLSLTGWYTSTIIPPKKFYLAGHTSYDGSPPSNVTYSANTIATNMGVALRNGAVDSGAIIDSVAWGTATNVFREGGVAASNPAANGSIERKASATSTALSLAVGGIEIEEGNGYDSNNNGSDFVVQTTSIPQSSTNGEEPDVTAPAQATLTTSPGLNPGERQLSWIAPGDDVWSGTGNAYTVKYSSSAITNDSQFTGATTYSQSWTPVAGTSLENRTVSGLAQGANYYFAVKARDEKANQSSLSNSPSGVIQIQAPVTVTNQASVYANNDQDAELLKFEVTNNAPDGNVGAHLYQVRVKFTKDGSTAMTTTEAQNLFEHIRVIKDNPAIGESGIFQPAYDTLVVGGVSGVFNFVNGFQTLNMTDPSSDTNAQISAGGSSNKKIYFVIGRLKSNAASQGVTSFDAMVDGDADVKIRTPTDNEDVFIPSVSTIQSQNVTVIAQITHQSGFPATASGVGNPIYSSPVYLYEDGRTYVGGDDGKLYVINPNGTVYWSFQASAAIRSVPLPIYVDGSTTYVYFSTEDGKVYKVKVNDSNAVWIRTLTGGTPSRSSPMVLGTLMFVGSNDAKLYKLNTSDGLTPAEWGFNTVGNISASAAIDWNNVIYVGSQGGTFYALSGTDGSVLNSFAASGAISGSPYLDVTDDSLLNVYVGSEGGVFYARNASNFSVPVGWSDFTDGGALGAVKSSPFIWGDFVYFGSDNGKFYKINKDTGALSWKFPSGAQKIGKVRGLPVVWGSYVYFGCDDGFIYAVDTAGGTIRTNWPVRTGGEIQGLITIDTDNNMMYVGSADGKVYKFSLQ